MSATGPPKPLDDALVGVFACPDSGARLAWRGDALVSDDGRSYPVVRGIPRFVASDLYVGSFSFEWTTHDRTQLDAFTGATDSERLFAEKTGLAADDVRGKLVLDAGVGAGRFSDVLSRWGAETVGVDLSYAVEAAHRNFLDRPNVVVAQADIARLPFRPETFDAIVSIGVLHHTPDTARHFAALVPLLKPGGRISIWVYPDAGDYVTRNAWIPFTSRIPARMFHAWCRWFVPLTHRNRERRWVAIARRVFPFSDQGMGLENDILDTFDGYSPRYHGIHGEAEVMGWFRDAGLTEVRALGFPTAVTGVKPPPGGG